ncbi:MAG: hypothetical protein LDL37_06970 [Asticcacaulis sp.]|uniref:hypothetical protein n=1 Tax=Asticcacaulis sp. TaxID=1872648 RepID=UPI0025BAC0C4|nr:hypothetical protein [Asticcacaulis sp.]MCA1935176.1 hypothetical protein [Asticcacaulis sp.]
MPKILTAAVLAALTALVPVTVWAQSTETPPSETTATPVAEPVAVPAAAVVPNGTPIVVEIIELVSTRSATVGDMFPLKLAEPVLLNGAVAIPEGTPGKGQVVDTGKPGMGGKPGKLVLAARYLEFEGRQIPIRALKLGLGARDNAGASAATTIAVGVFGLAVTGGHMEALPGTRASAKLAADFTPAIPPASQ